jgi:hypothetical protein
MNVEAGVSPIVSMVLGRNDKYDPANSWRISNDSSELIFSDSHGKVTSYSLEKGSVNGNFVGPSGSVLSLDIQRTASGNGTLACVGLDRYLRLFDLRSRSNLGNIYCKTKMTAVLIVEGLLLDRKISYKRRKFADKKLNASDDDGEESDSVWSALPKVSSGDPKRKRKRMGTPDGRSFES